MAAIQYLVPGGGYVNEDTSERELLIPGGAYLNEVSQPAATGPTMVFQSGMMTPVTPGYL